MKVDKEMALKTYCIAIAENMRKVTSIFADIEYFEKHGSVHKEPKVMRSSISDLSIAEMYSKLCALPSWITRHKQKHSKMPKGPQKALLADEIRLKEEELNEIKAIFRDETAKIIRP